MTTGRTRFVLGASAAVALALASCAAPGREAVPAAPASAAAGTPAALARQRLAPVARPADLGVVERFAWQTVEQLAAALEDGDSFGFLGKVSNGFYKGYARLDTEVNALIARTVSRSVVVAVRDVAVDGDRVSVRAQWAADYIAAGGGLERHDGTTTFLFLKSDTALRLLDYRGDPPFGIPGI